MLPSEGIKYLIKGIFVPEVLHATNVAEGVGLGVKVDVTDGTIVFVGVRVIDAIKVGVWVDVNVGEMVPVMVGAPV